MSAPAAVPPAVLAAPAVRADDDARVRASCLGGTIELRVRQEHGGGDRAPLLRVELRVAVRRPVRPWRVVVVHDRRLIVRQTRHALERAYTIRRTIPDWPGRETVTARVSAPDGRTCRAEASV